MAIQKETHQAKERGITMLTTRFGIEIEMTGITREKASEIASEVLGGTSRFVGTYYNAFEVIDQKDREWKFMSDASINTQVKKGNRIVSASGEYSVELVSPILNYTEDIDLLQNIIRAIRKAGGFTNSSTGIHIHLDGANHNEKTIRNFINIVASKNDLFYKALEIESARMRYCKKMDSNLVEQINSKKPKTLDQLKEIWYKGYHESQSTHYHSSRYHFLNLHSFFTRHHTVELRGFNSTLHAGKVRSYIVLALALNNQALTQKFASSKKPQTSNEKFAMRTYLNRIGFIGEDFKNCREHLCKNLDGSSAWRFGV